MAGKEKPGNHDQDTIALSREILPVWNLVATGLLLVASITTLVVFTAGSGRYVPTGSVMGFQGPSYFYVTGIWGLVVATCWFLSTVAKFKRLSISVGDGGSMLVQERVICGSRELSIPGGDLKVMLVKRYPTAGHITWLFIAAGWFAFLLQLAIPNFQLPHVGFPVAAMALLLFGGSMAGTAVIGVFAPGFHLVIVDKAARHVIKLPGVLGARALSFRILAFLESRFHFRPAIPMQPGSDMKIDRRSRILLVGAAGLVVLGLVNVGLLLGGSPASSLNLVSALLMMMAGCIALIAHKNRSNTLPLHSLIPPGCNPILVASSRKPGLWFTMIGIAGCVSLWYFVGLNMNFYVTGSHQGSSNFILLALISLSYTPWCMYALSEPTNAIVVALDESFSAIIEPFSLNIVHSRRNGIFARSSERWWNRAILVVLAIVSLWAFFAGLWS